MVTNRSIFLSEVIMPRDTTTPGATPEVPEPIRTDEDIQDERRRERQASPEDDEEIIPMFGEDPGA